MEFRLLGPIEVRDGDGPIALGGPKQRTVLAHLVLRAGEVLSTDVLVDHLWGDEPPATARRTLQAYVSRLRRLLGTDRIDGHAGGYVLRAHPDEVDVRRVESLVASGRSTVAADPAAAAVSFARALDRWRGPALADLADEPSLAGDRQALDELRLTITEELVRARLQLGDHAVLVPELERLTQRHPLRERFWADLIVALYRSGRQADALTTFERLRRTLADELGVDPAPELQRLQARVLDHDPTLGPAGRRLRGYRLQDELGRGAYGVVHRALQPSTDREVAVKALRPDLADDPDFIHRFEVEAQIIARLEHPHIVPLYDYWREPGGAYVVMRLLRGGTLADRLRDDPAAVDVAAMVDQIGAALHFAHRHGVVHGDVKASNVLFDTDGHAFLADFAIADGVVPTSGRSSPEAVAGGPVTPASDVYCLGAVLDDLAARRSLPDGLGPVIATATAPDPADRYDGVDAMVAAAHAAFGGGGRAAPPAVDRNPFKGLRPFLEADAADFFGRDAAVDRLVARLGDPRAPRFLAVVGPSGAGKSSLVRAGLVPALRGGALPGSERWFHVDLVPGADPFGQLAAALLRLAPSTATRGLADRVARDPGGLDAVLDDLVPPGRDVVLVIDQFEELFTLVDRPAVRDAFLDRVVAAATAPQGRLWVVTTLRVDLADRPMQHPVLAELLRTRTELVVPLSPDELAQAITGPAQQVGLAVEPELVARLTADVADAPGALPLLQFTLHGLVDQRDDGRLTTAAYDAGGGLTATLARQADATWSTLDHAGREATRLLFLRLVTVDDGPEVTRRRVRRSELTALGPDGVDETITAFGTARLLTFDRDPATREPTVEVAHEALLSHWGRLRAWIDAARDDLRTHRRLRRAAAEWDAAGCDRSFLPGGAQLAAYESWARTSGLSTTPEEQAFLDAAVAERDRATREEQEREAHERDLERRSLRRLRSLVAVLGAAAVVASSLTAFALAQRRDAEAQARVASARELAAASGDVVDRDAELATLLALEAVDRTRDVDPAALAEARTALHRAVAADRIALSLRGVGAPADVSPDGALVVVQPADDLTTVQIRDAVTGEVRHTLAHRRSRIVEALFHPDGERLVTVADVRDDTSLRVWDVATGAQRGAFSMRGHFWEAWAPTFSADGSTFALLRAGNADFVADVAIVDLATGGVARPLDIRDFLPAGLDDLALAPDGSAIAVSGRFGPPGSVDEGDQGTVVVYDRSTGAERYRVAGRTTTDEVHIDWSPDGRWLAFTDGLEGSTVLDAATGAVVSGLADSTDLRFSRDGARLVGTGQDGDVRVWDVTGARPVEIAGVAATTVPRGGLVPWPDGRRVLAAGEAHDVVRVLDVDTATAAEIVDLPSSHRDRGHLALSPDGRLLARHVGAGEVVLTDTSTWRDRRRLRPADPEPSATDAIHLSWSADGERIAIGHPSGWEVLDAATGERQSSGRAVPDDYVRVGHDPVGGRVAVRLSGRVELFDRDGQRAGVVRHSGGNEASLAFSPDGRHLAVTVEFQDTDGLRTSVAQVYELVDEAGRQQAAASTRGLAAVVGADVAHAAFDPTGELLVLARSTTGPEVWDWRAQERVLGLPGHPDGSAVAAFSADGATLATADDRGIVRLHDATTGQLQAAIDAGGGGIGDLVFGPDGTWLAVASHGSHRVLAADLDLLVSIAEGKLSRGFTDDECRRYLRVEPCPEPV